MRAMTRDPLLLVPSLAAILSNLVGTEIIVATTVDADGNGCDSEFFCSEVRSRSELPVEEIFYWCERDNVPQVMVTSKARGPIDVLCEEDLQFTRELIAVGRSRGVELFDHIVVGMSGEYRRMREVTPELWS